MLYTALGSFVLSFILTGAMRRYALKRNLVDVPSARSSHAVSTPRGGGLAIVLTLLLAITVQVLTGHTDSSLGLALGGAGVIVAGIGFWDDHGHIPARWRLIGHFMAAAWGVFWLGGFPPVEVWGAPMDLGWVGHLAAIVFIVWLLNLYNFMDGINGIASIEALSVTSAAALLMFLDGAYPHLLFYTLIGASAGFLVWNFPRARIFMGDACSSFLGLLLGLFAIWQAKLAPELFLSWLILLGVFITDATVTLFRRVIRGERFYEAHRSHAYQYASRYYRTHTWVSLVVAAINLLWLLPFALLVSGHIVPPILGVIVAYAPLVVVAFYFKAGAKEQQESLGLH